MKTRNDHFGTYRGYRFAIKGLRAPGRPHKWLVDIGCDDIWEPAGLTKSAALGYAKTVIDTMIDDEEEWRARA